MDNQSHNKITDNIPFYDLLKTVLSPGANVVGETIALALDFVCSAFSQPLLKRKIRNNALIDIERKSWEELVNRIGDEINLIPTNLLVKPKLHVILPIIDQAKFFVSEESFRLRFGKLIAATCNSETADLIKPIHSHVMSNMSSVDAHIFNFICQNLSYDGFDYVIPRTIGVNGGFTHKHNPFSRSNIVQKISILDIEIKNERNIIDIDIYDDKTISESVDTLVTLGLFSIEKLVCLPLMDPNECTNTIITNFNYYYNSETYKKYVAHFKNDDIFVTCQPFTLIITTLGEAFALLSINQKFLTIDNVNDNINI